MEILLLTEQWWEAPGPGLHPQSPGHSTCPPTPPCLVDVGSAEDAVRGRHDLGGGVRVQRRDDPARPGVAEADRQPQGVRMWSLYLTSRSLDPKGKGRARWVTRSKTGCERVRDRTVEGRSHAR